MVAMIEVCEHQREVSATRTQLSEAVKR